MKIVKEKDGSYTFDGEGNTIAFPKDGEYGCKFEGFENDKISVCNWIVIGEPEKTRKIWNIVQEKTLKDKVKRFFRKLFYTQSSRKTFYSHSSGVNEFNTAYSISGFEIK